MVTQKITEVKTVESISVDGEARISVLTKTSIRRGDVEIAQGSNHRQVLEPGDDLTGQDPKVVAIAQATWTEELVAAYRAARPEVYDTGEPEPPAADGDQADAKGGE